MVAWYLSFVRSRLWSYELTGRHSADLVRRTARELFTGLRLPVERGSKLVGAWGLAVAA